jgi:hypothetical protein
MRRLLMLSITAVIVAAALSAQDEDKQGKAWLASCAGDEAAALNVTGIWKTPSWGMISLNQRKESRNIVGSGDGWDITGVVGGTTVCLVFSHKGKVAYSSKLTEEGPGKLSGVYANGLSSAGSKTTPMRLTK